MGGELCPPRRFARAKNPAYSDEQIAAALRQGRSRYAGHPRLSVNSASPKRHSYTLAQTLRQHGNAQRSASCVCCAKKNARLNGSSPISRSIGKLLQDVVKKKWVTKVRPFDRVAEDLASPGD